MNWRRRLSNLIPGKKGRKLRGQKAAARKKGPIKRRGDLPLYPRYRSSSAQTHWAERALMRIMFASLAIMVITIGWLCYDLPDIHDLNQTTRGPSILIKSEDGQIVGSFGDVYGDYIPFSELPASLVDAVIATEDRNFYHHFGIDPFGLLRATFANLRAHHVVQGGSTITQQVAKNVFLTPERSLARKIREMVLAISLERHFTKQEIMSIYLNRVYLGAGSYGVDAASRRYFGKSARNLTLSESAIMAGLLKAPSRYAPTSSPIRSRQRAEQVLANMLDGGFLTQHQVDKAKLELARAMNSRKRTAPSALYFADWIADQLPDYLGTVTQDIVVITTLRPDWQLMAEKAVNDTMDKEGESHDASQAALLSMTPDGGIRAMIGGRSYADSQFNRATQSQRQAGSAFKLFVYLAALEMGMSPDTLVDDAPLSVPISGGSWQPKNYTGKYLGTITIKEAVEHSINTVAVRVAMETGLGRVITMAHRLGVTGDMLAVPSVALGAMEVSLVELTTAYAHLAAGGAIVEPYGILEITDNRGKPLYRRAPERNGVVLRSNVIYEMNDMLLNVVENGTGKGARIGRPVAGKTGTTSDYKDAWFIGYTPDLITGVWVGNDDNQPMKKVTGGVLPASIFHDFMIAALAKTPVHSIPTSGGSSFLPWESDNADYPSQRPRRAQNSNVKLGPSFWDKLFGESDSRH